MQNVGGTDDGLEVSGNVKPTEIVAISVFGSLDSSAHLECAKTAVRRSFLKGEPIFYQGDRPTRFHVLLSGWIRILQAGADGEMSMMRLTGPGELFGSFALFTDAGYPADAVAAADGVELSWSEAQIRQLIDRYPSIAMNLVAVAAQRLAELQERVREISTQPAERRIANALLRLARQGARHHADGRIELLVALTRQDVAAISATTLYTASRIISAWQRKGVVGSSSRTISILNAAELKRIADGS